MSRKRLDRSGVRVRRLLRRETAWFADLTTREIGKNYDDIDESFAENILQAHFLGVDPLGYFTLSKTIWVGEVAHKPFGFFVTTSKRGGSVKMGPHVTSPRFRGQGLGGELRNRVIRGLARQGTRKIYADGPVNRLDMITMDLRHGLQVEAQLREQYRRGIDEIVLGKMIRTPTATPVRAEGSSGTLRVGGVDIVEPRDDKAYRELLVRLAPRYYDGIDEGFARAILDSRDRFQESFRRKGRLPLLIKTERGRPAGVAVAVPKRGGAVKVAPLLLEPKVDRYSAAQALVTWILEASRRARWRRVYTLVPLVQAQEISAFRESGFQVEGVLRSPYKPGVDVVVAGRLFS